MPKFKRRQLRRLVRDHIQDYLDENPLASQQDAMDELSSELREEYGNVTFVMLLQWLQILLPLIFELRNGD